MKPLGISPAGFPDRLQDLIDESGKSIKTLGKEIGISPAALSKYQNGFAAPGLEAIYKLAKYFDVSADYLLCLSDTRSTDLDTQSIGKMTGLSERAVKEITRQEINLSSYLYPDELINTIFDSPLYDDLMTRCISAAFSYGYYVHTEETLPKRYRRQLPGYWPLIGANSTLIDPGDAVDYYVRSAGEVFSEIVKELIQKPDIAERCKYREPDPDGNIDDD